MVRRVFSHFGAFVGVAAALAPASAWAGEPAASADLDATWIVVATALVLLMQVGFMLL